MFFWVFLGMFGDVLGAYFAKAWRVFWRYF